MKYLQDGKMTSAMTSKTILKEFMDLSYVSERHICRSTVKQHHRSQFNSICFSCLLKLNVGRVSSS